MTQFKNPIFKQLQAQWYQRLKGEGFNDIEATPLTSNPYLKDWSSNTVSSCPSRESFWAKHDYFYYANQFLNSHSFHSPNEKAIWMHHSEGKSLRDIAIIMRGHGTAWNKDNVASVINDLKELLNEFIIRVARDDR